MQHSPPIKEIVCIQVSVSLSLFFLLPFASKQYHSVLGYYNTIQHMISATASAPTSIAASMQPTMQPSPTSPSRVTFSEQEVDQILIESISNVKDENGLKLDVRSALPDLKFVISTATVDSRIRRYKFLGEAAAQFAIPCILHKKYPDIDDSILRALTKKQQGNLSQPYKLVRKQLNISSLLKAHFDLVETMNALMGVLYIHYGNKAIECILYDSVITHAEKELNQNLPYKLKHAILNRELNAISKFHILLQRYRGRMDPVYSLLPNGNWRCELRFQLTPNSRIYSHQAMGKNKHESKSSAAQQILDLLHQQPDILNELEKPAHPEDQQVVFTLPSAMAMPVTQQDSTIPSFVKTEPESMSTDQTTLPFIPASTCSDHVQLKTSDWQGDFSNNRFHINDTSDEETIRLMSELILGNGTLSVSGSAMSIANKTSDVDMEEMNQNNKRLRTSNVASAPTVSDPIVPMKEEPCTTSLLEPQVKIEAEQESILNTGAFNTAASLNTYSTAPLTPGQQVNQPLQQQQQQPTSSLQQPQFYSPEIADKVIQLFARIFMSDRKLLNQTREVDFQSVFRTLIMKYNDKVDVESKVDQIGDAHCPLFSSEVVVKYNKHPAYFIRCYGMARRKKEAERMAWSQLVNLIRHCS
ncbi:hypothetical protein BDF20DRAFT_998307 [Mycotypha africana]|uniref:uncharacterized protein n=1 Tax=Mycotypha africana TaxID=64632 RepID=UPI0022FFFA03|nr:uncharacterized protein BDF20DRAFT_998307 [Mycotypha africana]KAI8987734.1 hypothetical protein BDF20DRAFT_998307 [Mycotypha africana]